MTRILDAIDRECVRQFEQDQAVLYRVHLKPRSLSEITNHLVEDVSSNPNQHLYVGFSLDHIVERVTGSRVEVVLAFGVECLEFRLSIAGAGRSVSRIIPLADVLDLVPVG